MLTQGGITEAMADNASRIKKLEDSLAKVIEEKNGVVNTLNEHRVATKKSAG